MSHGITNSDSLFTVRKPAWHGLGTVLEEYPASVEDALEKSGLGWEVEKRDLYVAAPPTFDGTGLYVPQVESDIVSAPDWKANVRSDTNKTLGIVGKDYSVVQNREAFAWLEALLGEELEWETAGSINEGRRVWVLAKIPEGVEIGGDATESYIYCANSHDGSMAVTAAATGIRIVCQNTLNFALNRSERNAQRTYKFRHTGNMTAKLDEARRVMEVSRDWTKALKELGDELAREFITTDRFDEKVVKPLFGLREGEVEDLSDRAKTNREEARSKVLSIFRGDGPDGDTRGNSGQSKWTALNAVGEYADHYRRTTKSTNQVARSFEDTRLKQAGLELVTRA